MTKRDTSAYFRHMLTHAQEAAALAGGKARADLDSDRLLNLALVRLLEIIGEAANHIPEDIQSRYPDIPWTQMRSIRNLLIHEYFGVDIDIIWQTITDDLPDLLKKITAVGYTGNDQR